VLPSSLTNQVYLDLTVRKVEDMVTILIYLPTVMDITNITHHNRLSDLIQWTLSPFSLCLCVVYTYVSSTAYAYIPLSSFLVLPQPITFLYLLSNLVNSVVKKKRSAIFYPKCIKTEHLVTSKSQTSHFCYTYTLYSIFILSPSAKPG